MSANSTILAESHLEKGWFSYLSLFDSSCHAIQIRDTSTPNGNNTNANVEYRLQWSGVICNIIAIAAIVFGLFLIPVCPIFGVILTISGAALLTACKISWIIETAITINWISRDHFNHQY